MKFSTNQLKALLTVAPAKDTRYYLNGVLCDPEGYAVATNGNVMLAVRIAPFDGSDFIIPRDACELALKAARKLPALILEDHEFKPVGIRFTPIDARFPDWRRAVPTKTTGEVAQFRPDLLMQLHKAAQHLNDTKYHVGGISHNGSMAGLVDVGPDALGIITPVRASTVEAGYAAEFLKPVKQVQS